MADYSDLDRQIEQLKRCEIIRESEVKALCAKAREILVEEGNVQRVDSPVTVCKNLRRKLLHMCSNSTISNALISIRHLGVRRYSRPVL